MHPAEAGARFTALVQGPDATIPLDEATLLIAADACGDVDIVAGLAELDRLAAGCPTADVDGLVTHLFVTERFDGDRHRYYAPDNSYLHRVLERRRGIPITLAVVMIEVGRRIGVDLEGVNLPGHFLVRTSGEPPELLDPFHGGLRVGEVEAQALLRATQGTEARLHPAMLAPVGRRAILARILTNLAAAHRRRGDLGGLLAALRLRSAIPGTTVEQRSELTQVLAKLS